MSNLLGIESEGGKVELIPEGAHDAVLLAVVQLGLHEQNYKGESKGLQNQLQFLFELPCVKGPDGKSRVIKPYNLSVGSRITEKNGLFKMLKNMGLMKKPTLEEVDSIFGSEDSLKGILGTKVSLEVVHKQKKDSDEKYAIVDRDSIKKLDPRVSLEKEPELEPYIFSFANPDIDVFKEKLTKWTRQTIMYSENAKELPKPFHEFYINEQEAEKEDSKGKEKVDKAKGVI